MEITTQQGSLADKIIEGLKKAAVELEEFRVQVALGKMEVGEIFADVKKSLHETIHEIRRDLASAKEIVGHGARSLENALENVEVQLTLGNAKDHNASADQCNRINLALHELEKNITTNQKTGSHFAALLLTIKKLTIKLHILKLKFDLKEFAAEEKLKEKKIIFQSKIENLKAQLKEKEELFENTWEHFSEEMHEAFSHLKAAFHA